MPELDRFLGRFRIMNGGTQSKAIRLSVGELHMTDLRPAFVVGRSLML